MSPMFAMFGRFLGRSLSNKTHRPVFTGAATRTRKVIAAGAAGLGLVGCCYAASLRRDVEDLNKFNQWIKKYHRFYQSYEQKYERFDIFRKTLRLVEKDDNLDLNAMADMLPIEMCRNHALCSCKPPVHYPSEPVGSGSVEAPVPDKIDWRKISILSPVRMQYKCHSCWAIAASGAIEAGDYNRTGKLLQLSVQQIIDCDRRSFGCMGGWCEWAFAWVMENRGITSEEEYPYMDADGPCQKKKSVTCISGYKMVPSGSVESLKRALSQQPVTAYLPVGWRFKNLKAGRIHMGEDSSICGFHAVLIVGYDKTVDGTEYFILKNSWGETWADKGFGFISAKLVDTGELSTFLYPVIAHGCDDEL